ncbi:ras-related protein Rab-21 [Episyrphus balteatus]|uniref:ras-related protein Rab-21 n=1 Tax=Episyrphus balteatus TaxID=286459 RepID=UPI002485CA59|nr:ras-related protein Rab-21 [Episyrphus balteatus]
MSTNANASSSYNLKIVLLGEGCVGKTSIVLRYVEDKFNNKHISTLQASFLTKKITLGDKRVQLNIWDTAGQERFHALGPIYYRASNGAILVYDITDQDSFQKVKNWVKELKKMLGSDIVITIVGNKTDLDKDRTVNIEEAQSYAQAVGATFFETSAKLNEGIEELFQELTTLMIQHCDLKEAKASTLKRNNSVRSSNRLIVDDSDDNSTDPNSTSGSRCCSTG